MAAVNKTTHMAAVNKTTHMAAVNQTTHMAAVNQTTHMAAVNKTTYLLCADICAVENVVVMGIVNNTKNIWYNVPIFVWWTTWYT